MQSQSNLRNQITLACCVLAMISLLFSKFLLTLAMIGLITNAVIHPDVKVFLKKYSKDKLSIGLTLLFFLFLFSYINSENTLVWVEKVRVKLPFLILPFALGSLLPLPKRHFHFIILSLWLIVFATCLYSTIHFYTHYEASINSYVFAKVMWTPKDHIRFSLAVAVCVWCGIYLYRESFFIWHKAEKYIYFIGSILMVFYLHLLSVRSGLLGLYLSTMYFVFYFLLVKKKWKHAFVAALSAIILFASAYAVSPTIRLKIGYMKYDVGEYFGGKNINGKSDAGRLMSQKMSLDVLRKNIFTGVGVGDVKEEVKKEYATQHPEIEENQRFEPHSEFLFVAVGLGIILGTMFFLPIFGIFFSNKNYRKWLLACVYIILLSSFFTEATLEMQVGTALFLFIVLLLHFQFKPLSEL